MPRLYELDVTITLTGKVTLVADSDAHAEELARRHLALPTLPEHDLTLGDDGVRVHAVRRVENVTI